MIELMVVIAIAAILTIIAIPSFQDMIQRNRISGEINSFVGDLQYARAEAIKRGQTVTMCASSDGASCLGTNSWNLGWIVFQDLYGTGIWSAGDPVMRTRSALNAADAFASSPTVASFMYTRTGLASGLSGGGITMTISTTPANANATRCVIVNLVGHQTSGTPSSGCK